MTGKNGTETRMTLYRLLGLPDLRSAVLDGYLSPSSRIRRDLKLEGRPALLVAGKTRQRTVQWASTLEDITAQGIGLKNSHPAAVLLIEDVDGEEQGAHLDEDIPDEDGSTEPLKTDAWAITFGRGFQMLDQRYIDNGFGQRIAIRAAFSTGLNSISKTTLDHRPRIERSTIASGSPLRSFGFEELGDLATRLVTVGKIANVGQNDEPVKIAGADSLSLPLSKDPSQLLKDLEEIKATLDFEPASGGLTALEQLILVKDKDLLEELDAALLHAIGEDDNTPLTISYPHELIDEYGNAIGYKLRGTRQRVVTDAMPTLEALLKPLKDTPAAERGDKLDSLGVHLFGPDDDETPISPRIRLKQWLAFQADVNGATYYLHNGKWYEMSNDYATVVRRRTKEIFDRGPLLEDLPPWSIVDLPEDKDKQKKENRELKYNQMLASHLNGLCLDQKLVRSELHKHGIEACDVLLKDGTFIHVKHVSSSAPASHLLAQALVSTEVLTHDKEAQEHLREHIREAGGNVKHYPVKPSKVVIVLAKNGTVLEAADLFTFTQVNLARQVAHLQGKVDIYIAPIAREVQT